MKITLFRPIPRPDHISMEIYADGLLKGLNALSTKNQVNQFRLNANSPIFSRTADYFRRYVLYPARAIRCQGDINHVTDYGYAFLGYFLDPRKTIVTFHDGVLFKCRSWRMKKSASRV